MGYNTSMAFEMKTEKGAFPAALRAAGALLSAFALTADAAIPTASELLSAVGGGSGFIVTLLARLRLALPDEALFPALLALGLFLLFGCAYAAEPRPKPGARAVILALLFAGLTLCGRSMDMYGSLCLFYEDGVSLLLALLWLAGWSIFYHALLTCAYSLAERLTEKSAPPPEGRWTELLTCKRSLWGGFGLILLCWSPYLAAYFPASVSYDAMNQLNTYFGLITWYNNHPVLSTLIMGVCVSLGRLLGSDNLGIFLMALLQSLSLAFAAAYSVRCMARWGAAAWARWAALIFFALTPIFPFFAQWVVKDTLYIAWALVFSCLVMDCAIEREKPVGAKRILALLGLGLLLCLLRKNGALLAAPSLAALVIARRGREARLRLAAALFGVLALYACWNYALVPAMGIGGSSRADVLSAPLQQTARCVLTRGGSVTEEERAAISAVLVEGGYERLGTSYNARISDPVKNLYDNSSTPAELRAFLKVWLGMAARHPVVCAEAFFANTYAYYCPDAGREGLLCFGYWIEENPDANLGFFDFHYLAGAEGERCGLLAVNDAVSKAPVVSLLYSQGFFTWLLLALTAYAGRKRRPGLIAGLTPALATLFMCVLSSVNGEYRYFMPVITAAPMMLAGVLCGVRKDKE